MLAKSHRSFVFRTLLVTKHNIKEQEWHIFSPQHCIQVREQSSVRALDISVNTIDQVKV